MPIYKVSCRCFNSEMRKTNQERIETPVEIITAESYIDAANIIINKRKYNCDWDYVIPQVIKLNSKQFV